MRALLAALLAALLVVAGGGQAAAEDPVTVRSEVDRRTIAIGDRVLLTITADLGPGYRLLDPGVPRVIGDFEVLDILTVLQSRLTSGATRVQLRYLITTWQLGQHEVPVIAVGYTGPKGEPGTARTQVAHAIDVRSVIQPGEDTGDIKPLKPPLPLPGAATSLFARLAPVVATVLALALAVVLALRLRRRGPAVAGEAGATPAQRALTELERVADLRLPEKGRTREHYELVSAALRTYAADRFRIRADARTARELRRDLERAGVERHQAQLLYEVLRDAEAVRFEEHVVYPARAHATMRDVLEAMRKAAVTEEYELAQGGVTV